MTTYRISLWDALTIKARMIYVRARYWWAEFHNFYAD